MRILMIEDDKKLCASVKFQLEKQGYSCLLYTSDAADE